jgi:hypothetical protein
MNQLPFLIKKHFNIFIKNIIYSERLTCYPEEQRKNKFQIFVDNLIWLLCFHQANELYYILGFDRKNNKQCKQKFISGRKCKKIIARKDYQFNKNVKDYDIIIDNKFIAAQYMESLGYPVPKTMALIDKNSILFPESGDLLPLAAGIAQRETLFRDCICKPIADLGGRGVFHMEIHDGTIRVNDKIIQQNNLDDLFSKSPYLVQEKISQHKKMAKLNPHSVNTMRLVTCFDGAMIKPFSAAVRIGIEGKVTDNWHTGGVIVRLNLDTGCLDQHGFTMPVHAGKKYDHHPETGVIFEGYEIPYWREAVELATKLHRYYYCKHSIGWDIAITEQGPVFIEANQGWDPYIHLVTEDYFMDKFLKYFM